MRSFEYSAHPREHSRVTLLIRFGGMRYITACTNRGEALAVTGRLKIIGKFWNELNGHFGYIVVAPVHAHVGLLTVRK